MGALESFVSLVTLSGLQVVLSIDNIVVIVLIAGALPAHQRDAARVIGLSVATVTRLLLLFFVSGLTTLTSPLVELGPLAFSGRDLLMLGGGGFLLWKSGSELFEALDESEEDKNHRRGSPNFSFAVVQIVAIDIIFSLDSIMATVGMSNEIWIMSAAVIIGSIALLVASGPIMRFIMANPPIKILALAFVALIGVTLVSNGFGYEIPHGYIYFAIMFSLFVECLNIVVRRRHRHRHAGTESTSVAEPYSPGSHAAE